MVELGLLRQKNSYKVNWIEKKISEDSSKKKKRKKKCNNGNNKKMKSTSQTSQIQARKQYKVTQTQQPGKQTGQDVDKTKKQTTTNNTKVQTNGQQSKQIAEPSTSGGGVVDVVYLEPVDFEKTTVRFPIEVARILNVKKINYMDIVRVGKLRFKITFETEGAANVLRREQLEQQNLKCFVPFVLRQTIGLVKGIPREYEEEDVKDNMESEVEVTKVERMKKRNREGELFDTTNVKVTFQGNKHPESIAIFGCKFKVELYIFPVKQCMNCWGYGHKKDQCKRVAKCRSCGEEKHQDECRMVKCINCGGNHKATERECPMRQEQREITEVMQREKISFGEARKKCIRENTFDILPDDETEFPILTQQQRRMNTGSQRGSQYKMVFTQRKGARTQQRQGRPNFAQLFVDENVPHQFNENPYKTGQWERTITELRRFWRNLDVVRKIMKLHAGINAEIVCKEASAIMYEELLIRISTSLQEIIEDVTKDLAEITEDSETTHENNNNNG